MFNVLFVPNKAVVGNVKLDEYLFCRIKLTLRVLGFLNVPCIGRKQSAHMLKIKNEWMRKKL